MTSSADDKRWAILPPPSPESSSLSGDLHLDPSYLLREAATSSTTPTEGVTSPARSRKRADPNRTEAERHVAVSTIHALEPEDSSLLTERPPEESSPRATAALAQLLADRAQHWKNEVSPESEAPESSCGPRPLSATLAPSTPENTATIPAPSWIDELDLD